MNKEVVTFGGAVIGGLASAQINAMVPQKPDSGLMNIVTAGAAVFGATKVSGTGTKENLLRGALMGVGLSQLFIVARKAVAKHYAGKEGELSKKDIMVKRSVGLGCPDEGGLQGGLMGTDGNVYEYDESGLAGTFMDENGNVFQQADGLNGVEEDIYGLQGAEEEIYGLQGAEEELYGLQGDYEEEY
jgi:hypothetical protein